MKEEYRSRVYTDRPAYADLPAPDKFQAIMGIIATRLKQHPNAICSYSGGSDSDIMLDLIERTREAFHLPPVKYAFFNTGLEMAATKNHVKATAEKYGVEITTYRPKVGIVNAVRNLCRSEIHERRRVPPRTDRGLDEEARRSHGAAHRD